MQKLFSTPEPQQNFTGGVPGVQWKSSTGQPGDRPSPPPALTGVPGQPEDTDSFALFLGLVTTVALILRLLVVGLGSGTGIEAAYTPDTAIEMQLADNLVQSQSFGVAEYPQGSRFSLIEAAREARGERKPFENSTLYPDAYHVPGYASVLALFQKLELHLRWLLLTQCLIAAGSTLVMYRIVLNLIGRKAPALLAASLTAVHPALVIAPAALSGGVIALALLLLGLWAVARRNTSNPLIACAGGLAFGIAALFNPTLFWAAPVVGAWLLISGRNVNATLVTAALLFGSAVPSGLWIYRNAQAGFGPTLACNADLEKYLGVLGQLEAPHATPNVRDEAMLASLPKLSSDETKNGITLLDQIRTETHWRIREQGNAYFQLGRDLALRRLIDHSVDHTFARLKLDYTAPQGGVARWLDSKLPQSEDPSSTTSVVNAWVGSNFLLLAATIMGSVALMWRRRIYEVALPLSLGLTLLVSCLTVTGEAARLPVISLQLLLVAGILCPVPVRAAKRSKKRGGNGLDGMKLQRITPGPGGPLAPLGTAPAPPHADNNAASSYMQSSHETDSPSLPTPGGRLI